MLLKWIPKQTKFKSLGFDPNNLASLGLPILGKKVSTKEDEEGLEDGDFSDEEEEDDFYDFHEPMKNPDILI